MSAQTESGSGFPLADDRVVFEGGEDSDRAALWELQLLFLAANDVLDTDMLRQVWSGDPDCWHFNLNGFTYYGVDEFCTLWDFYRPQFEVVEPFDAGRTRITIRGDMAIVATDNGRRHKRWKAHGGEGLDGHQLAVGEVSFYRGTQVFERTEEGWRVIHAHFSEQAAGERPGFQHEPNTITGS